LFYHESWQNDICSFRTMTVALTMSFKLINFEHLYYDIAHLFKNAEFLTHNDLKIYL